LIDRRIEIDNNSVERTYPANARSNSVKRATSTRRQSIRSLLNSAEEPINCSQPIVHRFGRESIRFQRAAQAGGSSNTAAATPRQKSTFIPVQL